MQIYSIITAAIGSMFLAGSAGCQGESSMNDCNIDIIPPIADYEHIDNYEPDIPASEAYFDACFSGKSAEETLKALDRLKVKYYFVNENEISFGITRYFIPQTANYEVSVSFLFNDGMFEQAKVEDIGYMSM